MCFFQNQLCEADGLGEQKKSASFLRFQWWRTLLIKFWRFSLLHRSWSSYRWWNTCARTESKYCVYDCNSQKYSKTN